MKWDSKEIAYRIKILTAFQNGEEIEHRNKTAPKSPWAGKFDGFEQSLSFNFETTEYRKKPQLREGYIFASMLHKHPGDFPRKTGRDTCFKVREVPSDVS